METADSSTTTSFPSKTYCPPWEMALRSKLQRPHVNRELDDIRQRTTRFRRLSDLMIRHLECGHRYRVKRFGMKEKFLLEQNSLSSDHGSCSVCWRFDREADSPFDLVDEYQRLVGGDDDDDGGDVGEEGKRTWDAIDRIVFDPDRSPSWDASAPRAVLVEKAFYEWLYQ